MLWRWIAGLLTSLILAPSLGLGAAREIMLTVDPVKPKPGFLEELIVEILPAHMSPTDSKDDARRQFESGVTRKVGEDLFQSGVFSKNGFGKLVKDIKGFSNHSLQIQSSSTAGVTKSSLRFNVDAYSTKADVNYAGLLDSHLMYIGKDHKIQWQISKNLAPSTQLSLKEEWCFSEWQAATTLQLGYHF